MQPLIITSNSSDRTEVLRAKRGYGASYGTVIGLAFALSAWGLDGYLLSQVHGIQPWLKLLVGMLICALVGRIAGWLVMRVEQGLFSVIVWLFPAGIFAWLTVSLPLQIVPRILTSLSIVPVSLPYIIYDELLPRFGVAFVWVAIFVLIAGLLELPMGEPAAFSTSILGRIGPALVCIALMGIAGFIVDNLNNEPLRNAVVAMDKTVQFAREHYKPVMIEAASQGTGWDEWFIPFFKFVTDNNDVVRAVTYANVDESRIQLNDEIIKRWKAETKQSFWLRGGPELFDELGFAK